MSTLALYETAREALATAIRIDEVLDVRDAGERARLYARQAKDRQLQADAAALVVRAERRLGEILRMIKAAGELSSGGRPSNSNLSEPETGTGEGPVFDATTFTLADLGISKNLSSRAQQLADLDEDEFEHQLSARRDKILSTDAAVINPKPARPAAAPKPAPIKPLPADKFHRFTFAVLALTMASDRVSSEALQKLAEFSGIVVLDGETIDFTPEAFAALGPLADVALKALDGEEKSEPATPGFPPEVVTPSADESVTGGEPVGAGLPAIDFLAKANLREAYDGEIALLLPHKGKLSMAKAGAAMRAGYAAEVPVLLLAEDLGHPLGTVKTWANRLKLTSIDRMHDRQHRFGDEQ